MAEYFPVVLDLGLRYVRLGFSGERKPFICSTSGAGRAAHSTPDLPTPAYLGLGNAALTEEQRKTLLEKIVSEKGPEKALKLFASDHGSWLDEGIFEDAFSRVEAALLLKEMFLTDLMVLPLQCKVFVTENRAFSVRRKYAVSRWLLHDVRVKSVVWVPLGLMAMAGSGLENAMVVSLGWESVLVEAVFDMRVLHSLACFEALGLFDGLTLHYKLVERLADLKDTAVDALLSRGDAFEILENFVANAVYVRENTENDDSMFELHEDVKIPGKIRHEVVEGMLFGTKNNLPRIILDLVEKTALDVRPVLLENVLFTGGVAKIPGLKARMVLEIRKLSSANVYGRAGLGQWAGCSLYTSAVLLKQSKSYWKTQEFTRDTIKQGPTLSLLPDAHNALYKAG